MRAVFVGCFLVAACGYDVAETSSFHQPLAGRTAPRPAPLGQERARALLAAQVRPGESLVEVVPWTLPVRGKSLAVGVARDAIGARRIAVDENGAAVEFEAALAMEQAALVGAFGKMTEALYEQQRPLADDQLIEFYVFVGADVEPAAPPYDGTDVAVPIGEYADHVRAIRAAHRTALNRAKAPLREWLSDRGADVADLAASPLLRVRGPAALLRESRIHDADVIELLEAPESDAELLGFAGHASMREANLSGGLCGGPCLGGGVALGIWERDTQNPFIQGAIATDNTRLPGSTSVTYMNPPTTCSSQAQCADYDAGTNVYRCVNGKCVAEHLSTVAASIGMQGSYTYAAGVLGPNEVTIARSGSPNTARFVANDSGPDGIDWLLDATSAVYVNKSFSSADGVSPVIVNWAARNQGVFASIASGNTGSAGVVCAAYWNGLCVGNYRYETFDQPSTHRRHGASSFTNQTSLFPGQERPHLLGPGAHLAGTSTTSGLHIPNISVSGAGTMSATSIEFLGAMVGTSFAAPAILSTAIQAHQYEGWFSNLYYPIMRKAVLLASTIDSNADGQVLTGSEWTSTPDGEDGAGHPDLQHAKDILDSNRYKYVALTNSSFVSCGTGCREYTIQTFNVSPGRAIRAALVWNACATSRTAFSTQTPTDFDLVLVQPSWCLNALRQSTSLANELEVIHDTCLLSSPFSGTYTAKVRIKNGGSLALCGSATSEPVAFAWSSRAQ